MSDLKVDGYVKVISETAVFGDNGFRKRELVVQTEDQYPQSIQLEFVQDKVDLLNAFSLGDKVSVDINIRGREWTSPDGVVKYFNTLQGWRITKVLGEVSTTPSTPATPESKEDLPF
jgi:hypothetical protein